MLRGRTRNASQSTWVITLFTIREDCHAGAGSMRSERHHSTYLEYRSSSESAVINSGWQALAHSSSVNWRLPQLP